MKRLIVIAMVVLLSAPIAFAQDICESDFTCDGDVDSADVSTFLEDFGRSEFFNPCPPCSPLPVAKTGQTNCYDETGTVIDCSGTGQDGEYQMGFAPPTPRFTDNEDGTVTDNLTGLFWLKNGNCFLETKTWSEALSVCNGLADGQCDLSDGSEVGQWRVPNVYELYSLIDRSNAAPALTSGHPFVDYNRQFWTSNSKVNQPAWAWSIGMSGGHIRDYLKTSISYAICVRGGNYRYDCLYPSSSCPSGQIDCDGICIDPSKDREYCGATEGCLDGTVCADGEICSAGICILNCPSGSCPSGQIDCGGTCVDPLKDREYCGATEGCLDGTVCLGGEICSDGTCTLNCPPYLLECDGKCVDPLNDILNCGYCGNDCTWQPPMSCRQGSCSCPPAGTCSD